MAAVRFDFLPVGASAARECGMRHEQGLIRELRSLLQAISHRQRSPLNN